MSTSTLFCAKINCEKFMNESNVQWGKLSYLFSIKIKEKQQ